MVRILVELPRAILTFLLALIDILLYNRPGAKPGDRHYRPGKGKHGRPIEGDQTTKDRMEQRFGGYRAPKIAGSGYYKIQPVR